MADKTCGSCIYCFRDEDDPSVHVCRRHHRTVTPSSSACPNHCESSGSSGSSSGGCYIATCVYGSYDCPPVWTLRRYRDNVLAKTAAGRTFINIYYAISPKLVKWFGNTGWFKKMWKTPLDKLVSRLNNSGIKDTSYKDN